MIDVVQRVHDTALAVMADGYHVTIDQITLGETAQEMIDNPLPEKQVDEDKVKQIPDLESNIAGAVILEELVADSINYCYWLYDSDYRPSGAGSTLMRELLKKNFNTFAAIKNEISLEYELRRFYKSMLLKGFPLMDKRREHLMALLRPVYSLATTGAKPTELGVASYILVRGIQQDLRFEDAFKFLIREIDGYGDDPFLKRAFLFFLQLNRIFGLYEEGIKMLPVPADYQVPKMLHYYGILKYSKPLEWKVRKGTHFMENGPEEMSIRAATILACEMLCEETGWSPSEVDGWFFVRRNECEDPFHLCITSNY